MKTLIEYNTSSLESPDLVGTDEEKIKGIHFWADVVAMLRTINTTFISHENKQTIIAAIKRELDIVDVEINNISTTVISAPGEIPSMEKIPTSEPAPETNIVDLTNDADVAASVPAEHSQPTQKPEDNPVIKPAVPLKKAPTFENLDKLRRVSGSGQYDKNFVPSKVTAKNSIALDKLQRAAGAGIWDKNAKR